MTSCCDRAAPTRRCCLDLISAGGQVTLVEREPHPDEIGKRPIESQSLIVRVVRGQEPHSIWDSNVIIQPGDKLIVMRPPQAG
jgi:voltage-gated potassium channel